MGKGGNSEKNCERKQRRGRLLRTPPRRLYTVSQLSHLVRKKWRRRQKNATLLPRRSHREEPARLNQRKEKRARLNRRVSRRGESKSANPSKSVKARHFRKGTLRNLRNI